MTRTLLTILAVISALVFIGTAATSAQAHGPHKCYEALDQCNDDLESCNLQLSLAIQSANDAADALAGCRAEANVTCPDVTVTTTVLKCRKVFTKPNGTRVGKGCVLITEASE